VEALGQATDASIDSEVACWAAQVDPPSEVVSISATWVVPLPGYATMLLSPTATQAAVLVQATELTPMPEAALGAGSALQVDPPSEVE
jgi:hypothetical protein